MSVEQIEQLEKDLVVDVVKVKKVYYPSKLLKDPEYRKLKNKAYYDKNKFKILENQKKYVREKRDLKNHNKELNKKMKRIEKFKLSHDINEMIKDFFMKQPL